MSDQATPQEHAAEDPGMSSELLLSALHSASAWLDLQVSLVNSLNVFPVPDGDTGTNMSLTMRAALDEADSRAHSSVSDLIHVVAHGALMGARGNSGVILSQILRGFAHALDGSVLLRAQGIAQAMRDGAATAYKGVMKPVEGTILTVVRESAEEAERAAASGAGLEQVLERIVGAAQASLDRTPTLLPVLADAGVVDAGGKGLVLILEGILRHIRGDSVSSVQSTGAALEHVEAPVGGYDYDTQFVIKGSILDVAAIRTYIAEMGDSVLVVGDNEAVKVHVHCNAPGAVLDYGISQGDITAIIVENMQLQYEEFLAASRGESRSSPPVAALSVPRPGEEPLSDICVVAVVAGDGLRQILESLGVSAIVSGGQSMNPSTQDLLNAIEQVSSDRVILLPNNSNIILAAEQARELSTKEVGVVPTKTVPQGIAALLAFNYQSDLQTNLVLMAEAGSQVKTGEVTQAVRSVQVNELSVSEGQCIGLIDGELTIASGDATSVVMELLKRMDADACEIVTVYYGEGVIESEAIELTEVVSRAYPELEIELLNGGQAHYQYIVSVE